MVHGSHHHPREIVIMSIIYRYRHAVRVLAVFACTLLGVAASAPAAFAMRFEDSGGSPGVAPTGLHPTFSHPVVAHTVVTGGMPAWQLTVIAAVASLLVATIAVVVHRVRVAHREGIVAAT